VGVEEDHTVTVRITAVGDLLMHMPVVNSAYDHSAQKYDFKPVFEDVARFFSEADYTIANLETRLAGAHRGFVSYPLFNTPSELAQDLRDLDVDLLTTANNHSLDMGWSGLLHTLDVIEEAGLTAIGTHRSAEEKERPFIVNLQGIQVGIYNCTYGTNGIPLPPDRPYAVNLINYEAIAEEITRLQEAGADIIIGCLHYGDEYQRQPSAYQKEVSKRVFELGTDIIIGGHPHVVQPMEFITIERDGELRECFVAYSLGNFISNQRWQYSDSGIILNLEITKDLNTGETELTAVDYIPVWVQKAPEANRFKFRIVPCDQAVFDFYDQAVPAFTHAEYQRIREVKEEMSTLIDQPEQGILPASAIAVSKGSQG
jgi:poly-gamma-glutamate synthesis protein (capsule biosynthesis protein)